MKNKMYKQNVLRLIQLFSLSPKGCVIWPQNQRFRLQEGSFSTQLHILWETGRLICPSGCQNYRITKSVSGVEPDFSTLKPHEASECAFHTRPRLPTWSQIYFFIHAEGYSHCFWCFHKISNENVPKTRVWNRSYAVNTETVNNKSLSYTLELLSCIYHS